MNANVSAVVSGKSHVSGLESHEKAFTDTDSLKISPGLRLKRFNTISFLFLNTQISSESSLMWSTRCDRLDGGARAPISVCVCVRACTRNPQMLICIIQHGGTDPKQTDQRRNPSSRSRAGGDAERGGRRKQSVCKPLGQSPGARGVFKCQGWRRRALLQVHLFFFFFFFFNESRKFQNRKSSAG